MNPPRSLNDPFYERPDDVAGTVFDPHSPTFGPILAAFQDGEFEEAARLAQQLANRCPRRRSVDPGQTTLA